MSRLLLKSANLIQRETVSFIKCGPYMKSSFIKCGGWSLITFIKCDIIGLVGAMAGVPPQILLDGDSLFTHFKGALTEQYVLEELTALGLSPNYWSPDNIKAEVEFLLQIGTMICPLEAKAETNLRAKSLKSYIDRFNPRKALRVSMSKWSSGERIDDYPLYAIPEAIKVLDQ